jgi:hypothetical protein
MIARIWTAAFAQGNLRLWAIILGAPPLCGIVVWVIAILEKLATAPDPVREALVNHIADLGKMIVLLVGVIVVALAAVKVEATMPGGSSLKIDGDE